MLERTKTNGSLLELDKVLQYAVTLAWGDLTTPVEPRAVRVEYICEPGSPLDHISVWSVRAGGYQDLVCDFWAVTSAAHPSGASFVNRYCSDKLAATLGFIVENQGQFTRPPDAGRHGLVLLYPPDAHDRAEAATWMKGSRVPGVEASTEEVQAQHQEEKPWTSTNGEEARLQERSATRPDKPVEAPAATNAANHFELRYAWPE